MARAHRVVGDHGDLATIRYTIVDADNNLVTTGTATLRIGGQADHPMTHEGSGVWAWTPSSGDLDLPSGAYRLEVHASDVTLNPAATDTLQLRARAAAAS